MAETFTEFDPAEYLSSPEAIAEFITDALETGDAVYIAKAMGVAARKVWGRTCIPGLGSDLYNRR